MSDRILRTSSRCTFDKPQCVKVRGDLGALGDTKTGSTLEDVNVRALVALARGRAEVATA